MNLKKIKKFFKEGYNGKSVSFYLQPTNLSLKYCLASYFDSRHMFVFGFGFGSVYIHFPWKSDIDDCEYPSYGFYTHASALWICNGYKVKAIHFPWAYDWVRTSYLRKDGLWEHEVKGDRKDFYENKWDSVLFKENHSYIYALKNGEIQHRTASIKVSETEWRMKWLKWTKLFAKKRKSIDVAFSDEVGERSGSWKGGTIGCGYTMKKGETPFQTLKRMEVEREF